MIRFLIYIFFFSTAWSFESSHTNSVQLGYSAYQGRFTDVDTEFTHLNITSENTFYLSKKSEFKISPTLLFWNFQTSQKTHFEGDAKELNYTYFGRDVTLQLGFFNLKKDGPDVIDPLDTFQPRVLIDPMNRSVFSVGGLRAEYDPFENAVFEFVFVPQNRISRIPLDTSPWYPREKKLPLSNDNDVANLPENPRYIITKNEAEQKSHLQNNYQLKGKFTFDQTDLFLQYNEALSLTPTITPVLSGNLINADPIYINLVSPVELRILWSKIKNYSAGVVSAFDTYRIIAKAFVNHQVTAVDKTTLSVLALEKQMDNTAVVFEASTSKTVSDLSSSGATSSLYSLYTQALVLGLRHSFNDDLSLLAGGLYDTYKGANFVYVKPKYTLNDHFSIELQAAFLGGKKDSLLWYFDQNDSYSARLNYSF